MASPLDPLLRQIRYLAGARPCRDGSDAELLQRFAAQREEAAFAELIHRHGPMIQRVCQRAAQHPQDAEDAFQATFLVLVRKASSIRKQESVGSWLYGVAYRVARAARMRADERRKRERQAMSSCSADPSAQAAGQELRQLLDEALAQLPAKYRGPLVLHYLEGKTKEETARQLGWSEGTVSGRLARARDLLRKHLSRRGLLLSSSAVAAALAAEGVSAALPTPLAHSTLNLAMLFAAGHLATSSGAVHVTALTNKVVKAMFLTRLKMRAAMAIVLAVVALGTGGLLQGVLAQPGEPQPKVPAASQPANPPAVPPKKHEPLLRIPLPNPTMVTVALSRDGKWLAMAPQNGKAIELWEVAAGKKRTLTGHAFSVISLAFSPDGETLASGTGSWLPDGAPGEIKLWKVASGEERATLIRNTEMIVSLAFSRDGKMLASASKTVKLWELASGKQRGEFRPENGYCWSVAFAPDGKTVAAGVGVWEDTTPGFVLLYDLASGKVGATLSGHKGTVSCLGFTPDGKTLASADSRGTLKLWKVAAGREKRTIPNSGSSFFQQSLAITPDDKTVLATRMIFNAEQGGRTVVTLWDIATGKERTTYEAFSGDGSFTAFSADATTVAWSRIEGQKGQKSQPKGIVEVWRVQALLPARSGK